MSFVVNRKFRDTFPLHPLSILQIEMPLLRLQFARSQRHRSRSFFARLRERIGIFFQEIARSKNQNNFFWRRHAIANADFFGGRNFEKNFSNLGS